MILGHDKQAAQFSQAMGEGRLHHAYLFSGIRGVGKASFAAQFFAKLLASKDGEMAAQADKLLAAEAHPDFLRVELIADPKTQKMRQEINRAQIDSVLEFLGKYPSIAARRLVLIDAIDDLNLNAANSLLKWLEEPRPGTCLILICHAPGGVLPTIRSRCAELTFAPLNQADFDAALSHMNVEGFAGLHTLSAGSPGQAAQMAGADVAAKIDHFDGFMARLPQLSPTEVWQFAAASQAGRDISDLRINLRILRHTLREIAAAGGQGDFALTGYEMTQGVMGRVVALNMDVNQVWAGLLLDLQAAARQGQSHG